jgi:hypothetical protein
MVVTGATASGQGEACQSNGGAERKTFLGVVNHGNPPWIEFL